METFLRIVDTGSITDAAEQLGTTKSATSRQLNEIEKKVGKTLINRTTRSLSLTQHGEVFYAQAKKICNDLYKTDFYTGRQSSTQLRIALPQTLSILHLKNALNTFFEQNPKLILGLDFSDKPISLIEDGFDCGIRIGNLTDSSLHQRILCQIEYVLCASPTYIATFGCPDIPEDFSQYQFLHHGQQTHQNFKLTHNKTRLTKNIRIKSALVSNNIDFLLESTLSGQGLFLAPVFGAYELIKSGRLVPVIDDWIWPSEDLSIIYPDDEFMLPQTRLFVDFIIEWFSNPQAWMGNLKPNS